MTTTDGVSDINENTSKYIKIKRLDNERSLLQALRTSEIFICVKISSHKDIFGFDNPKGITVLIIVLAFISSQ